MSKDTIEEQDLPKKKQAKGKDAKGRFKNGNAFYLLRTKSGRDALFADPELLWKEACRYFKNVIESPFYKYEAIKSGDSCGEIIEIPVARPFTMIGLCLFLDISDSYMRVLKSDCLANKRERSSDFLTVISRIEKTIYDQKFSGAASNLFNANIISRDLGLADNLNQTIANPDGSPLAIPQINVMMGQAPALASSEDTIFDKDRKLISDEEEQVK
jgi:hypothetical protein